MTLFGAFEGLARDYTLRTVALGSLALGAVSGALGSFAVLRRQSLLGDAISHSALPGVALAFLLTGSKDPLVLLVGAGAAGWIGMLAVLAVTNTTRVKSDSALGIVLSVFFGLGLVLLTFIQKIPTAAQSGLDKFLFGQAATLLERDVATIAIVGGSALLVMLLLWKELKVLSFDRDFGASIGLPIRAIEVVFALLLVTAIVIGLQSVGVVLMSAMVVAPAAAARQWTDRLGRMVLISATFGALAGVAGTVVSGTSQRLPTGPLIVLVAGALVVVSLFLAPARGLVWRWIRHARARRHVHADSVLVDLFALARQHGASGHAHLEASIEAMRPWRGSVARSLRQLAERGFVRRHNGGWILTPAGWDEASGLASRFAQVEP